MDDVQTRSYGVLINFPRPGSRPARPSIGRGEARGEILLFTGVRYERQPELSPEPSTPALAEGRGRSARRRRRS